MLHDLYATAELLELAVTVTIMLIFQLPDLKEFKPAVLQRRGPDCCKSVFKTVVPGVTAVFCGTVLHFRGSVTVQPLELNGNMLLWNGEVFTGLQVAAHFLCIIKLNCG